MIRRNGPLRRRTTLWLDRWPGDEDSGFPSNAIGKASKLTVRSLGDRVGEALGDSVGVALSIELIVIGESGAPLPSELPPPGV